MMLQIISDIKRALDVDCYFSALALALTLPDMCGKAEYPEKRCGERYKDWYDDNEANAIAVPAIRNDRNRFIGAVNYIIDIILEYNPNQKIAFIGHYESDRKQRVYLGQSTLFEYWSFPSLKLWEELNWTQNIDPETGKTITQTMMSDDLHPYSDTRIDEDSGFKVAIKIIGDCCYKFIEEAF